MLVSPPRLLMLDLDGTVLDDVTSAPPETLMLLDYLRVACGVRWGIATGRSPGSVLSLRELTLDLQDSDAPWVCAYGAVTVTHTRPKPPELPAHGQHTTRVHELPLTPDVLGTVISRLCTRAPDAVMAVERHETRYMGPGYPAPPPLWLRYRVEDVTDLASVNADLLRVRAPGIRDVAADVLADVPVRMHTVDGSADNVVITHAKASKTAGIARVAESMSIPQSAVWTIADGPGDVGMLRWAGTGIAMRNAPDEVKNAADAVLNYTNNAAGIAWFLKALIRLLPKRSVTTAELKRHRDSYPYDRDLDSNPL